MSTTKSIKLFLTLLSLIVAGILAGCSPKSTQSSDVSDQIRKSLDQASLKDVSVSQNREKGVVTLDGHVATESDKARAESITKSIAVDQVVANQIAVLTAGAEGDSKTMNTDLDKGIEHNLNAALVKAKLHKNVKYDVKAGVVTLTGEVDSQSTRTRAEKVASEVPNIKQVVNELQVKNQKASSST